MAKNENEIPKARTSRLFKMAAKMAVQQGRKYLEQKPESRLKYMLEQAETLVSHVGVLKGAAMKAVQFLSIEGEDFLPPEVIEVLEKLQSQAPPIKTEVLLEQIKIELGEDLFSQLKNLSNEPIAAASIGQVYSAEFAGKSVVIKVQYPGIAESVDSDINALKKLLQALLVVNRKKVNFEEFMEEIRRVLKLETDYREEEKSLIRYKELFTGTEYIIPTVYEQFTTQKVLVMSKENGLEFSEWLKSDPDEEQKQKVADQLLNLFIREFFDNRLVQTDPNPANFLITQEGQMVLIDFGATLDFEKDFVQEYQKMVRQVFSKDRVEILKLALEIGYLDPRESKMSQDLFVDFLLMSLEPFEEQNQPFDFSDSEYTKKIRSQALKFSRQLKYSAPPKKLIFLNRKLGGIFLLLKKMKMKEDLTDFRKMMVEKTYY